MQSTWKPTLEQILLFPRHKEQREIALIERCRELEAALAEKPKVIEVIKVVEVEKLEPPPVPAHTTHDWMTLDHRRYQCRYCRVQSFNPREVLITCTEMRDGRRKVYEDRDQEDAAGNCN